MSLPGFRHGLWRPDELRVAGICAEMARSHDFCVSHLNGRPFLEKPPLYFALGASTKVYFSYMTPKNNYLPFAREVFTKVKPKDLTILGQDEVMAGFLIDIVLEERVGNRRVRLAYLAPLVSKIKKHKDKAL